MGSLSARPALAAYLKAEVSSGASTATLAKTPRARVYFDTKNWLKFEVQKWLQFEAKNGLKI